MQVGGNPPKNEMKSGAEIRLAERIWIIAVRLPKGDRGLRPPGPRGASRTFRFYWRAPSSGDGPAAGFATPPTALENLLIYSKCDAPIVGREFTPAEKHNEEPSPWRRTGAMAQQRPERKTRDAH